VALQLGVFSYRAVRDLLVQAPAARRPLPPAHPTPLPPPPLRPSTRMCVARNTSTDHHRGRDAC
jgi:hypothetical protein